MQEYDNTRPSPGTLRVPTRFVTPDPPPRVIEVLSPTDLPAVPIAAPMPHSSHTDRAHGFLLATSPLAAATAIVVVLIGILAFGVPFLSVPALLLALAGFSFTWLVAYIAHTFVSTDGAMFLHVVLMWRLIFLESRERRKRYGRK
jgi:hypothetical protein